MSAKRASTERERDPHGVIPDSFLERYPAADSIREALRMAEREAAADRFELESRERCPECESTRLRKKHESVADQPNRREGAYKCANGHHFDTPLPSVNEEVGEQVTLSEVGR